MLRTAEEAEVHCLRPTPLPSDLTFRAKGPIFVKKVKEFVMTKTTVKFREDKQREG